MNDATQSAALDMRWIAPERFRARWEPECARLTVTLAGEAPVPDARVRPAFPETAPERFIEVRDGENREIGLLDSTAGMAPESLAALRAALRARYLIPTVTRILDIVERSMFVLRWRVETDRGPRDFHTESPREAIRFLNGGRLRVTDLAGNPYDIPDPESLAPESRARLAQFL